MSAPGTPASHHATALVLGEAGVIIFGESGAGKSSLALALIGAARARGLDACLVGDDRVRLEARGERLIARGVPVIAGQIEARGAGLIDMAHVPAAVLRAVVRLEKAPPRLPELADESVELLGIRLPQMVLRADADLPAKADLVLHWLERLAR